MTFSGIITLLGVIILKISFSSSSWMFSCLNADSWAFACLLVNMSSLSDIILTYSRCILGCLWLFLVSGKSARSTDRSACIMATNIKSICIRNKY